MSKIEAENDRDRVAEVLGDFAGFGLSVRIANKTTDRTIGQIYLTPEEAGELIEALRHMRDRIATARERGPLPL
jgi:hypothetical protein